MNTLLTKQFAIHGLLLILSLFVLFHLFILAGIVPFEMVWGGRLKDSTQMVVFGAVSFAINLGMLGVVGIFAGILKVKVNHKVMKAVLWAMCILFLLNTIGNSFSENQIEKIGFTPLTLLLSVFCLRLAGSNEPKAAC